MVRITDRLKALLRGAGAAEQDPLDYDQVVLLDAEELAEQGILSAYEELLPRLKRYVSSPGEVTEEIGSVGSDTLRKGAGTFMLGASGAI